MEQLGVFNGARIYKYPQSRLGGLRFGFHNRQHAKLFVAAFWRRLQSTDLWRCSLVNYGVFVRGGHFLQVVYTELRILRAASDHL